MINQFPDRRADEAAAKRHWVVRLRPRTVARGYAGIAVARLTPGSLQPSFRNSYRRPRSPLSRPGGP